MDMPMPLPLPIKLEKSSEAKVEIIDLDGLTSSEDIVLEWCTKVRMKFKNFFIADSERNLDLIMKWYIQSFKEEAMQIEDAGAVKPLLFKHIEFFKILFHELDCPFSDNYLDNMEELLSMYSDLETKTLPSKQNEPNKRAYKKSISNVCLKVIGLLNAYLMYCEDRFYHVLMKIKLNIHSEETRDFLNLLYGKILTKEPANKSDLAFCRAYILYQKWKKIRSPDDWEQMDELMYKMYNKTPDSLITNNTLKQILLPQSESILDVLSHISDNYTVISNEYFKFIKTQNIQEDSLISLDVSSIELDDQSGSNEVINAEDEEFEHAYNNYVESMARISSSSDIVESSTIKVEDEEDECIIVGVGTLDCEPTNSELIHEIVDDDDIIDIIFFEEKKKSKNEEASLSFLDSIDISKSTDVPLRRPASTIATSSTTSSSKSPWSHTFSPPSNKMDASAERIGRIASYFERIASPIAIERIEPPIERIASPFERNASPVERVASPFVRIASPIEIIPSPTEMVASPTERVASLVESNESPIERIASPIERIESPMERIASPIGREFTLDVLEQPSNLPSDDDAPKITVPSSSIFLVPSKKPPRTRKKGIKEPPRRKKFVFKRVIKKRRLLIKKHASSFAKVTNNNKHKNCVVAEEHEKLTDVNIKFPPDLPKSVNHIETQTDFPQGEPEDIYKRYKGLVTPPSDEHNEDHDIHTSKSSNVYTGFIPTIPCSTRDCMTETDYFASADDKIEIAEHEELEEMSNLVLAIKEPHSKDVQHSEMNTSPVIAENHERRNESVFEVKSSTPLVDSRTQDLICESSYIDKNKSKLLISTSTSSLSSNTLCMPSSDSSSSTSLKSPKFRILSNVSCTSTDISSDFSPSSSTVSPNVKHKRSNEFYSSPASPDISSTSHDNYLEGCSSKDGDSEENRMVCESPSGDLSDNEEDDYVAKEECNEDGTLNEGSDEILIEDHFFSSNNDEVIDSLNNPDNTEEERAIVCDDITKNVKCGIVHSSLSRSEEVSLPLVSGNEDLGKIQITEVCQLKQLTVSVPKINLNTPNLSKNAEKLQDQNFDKFKVIHSNWDQLLINHELDDILSGPIEKVNGISNCVNPDKTFDLFDNKTPSETPPEEVHRAPSCPSSDMTSPSYEPLDEYDFSLYMSSFNRENNGTVASSQLVPLLRKTKSPLKSLLVIKNSDATADGANSTTDETRSTPVRKKRVAFADDVIDNSTKSNAKKNTKRNTRPQIPRRLMNLKSLSYFNVKPSDPCIQGVPCVIMERISQMEIDQWKRASEISRKVRLQKSQALHNLTTFRVDYDKSTNNLNNKDIIQINEPKGSNDSSVPAALKQWRSNKAQWKTLNSQEGMVTPRACNNFSDSDYNCTPVKCNNACCSSLTTELTQLNVTRTRYENILNLSCDPDFSVSECQNCPSLNPFSSKLVRKKKRKLSQESTDIEASKSDYFYVASIIKSPDRCSATLDLNIISSIVESFDAKCNDSIDDFCINSINFDKSTNAISNGQSAVDSLSMNSLDFDCNVNAGLNQQPTVVPELEDFEKTLKNEELTRPLTMPSDLHNLNLNRFSPSPINCFSPRSNSPGHMFLSCSSAINESNFSGSEPNDSQMGNNYGIQPDSFFSQDNSFESFKYSSDVGSPTTENKHDPNEYQLTEDKKEFQDELKSEHKSMDYTKILAKLDMNSLEEEPETRLPLKKRKLSVANSKEEDTEDDYIGPDLVEEILKRARAERAEKEDISYPAKPAISIAEIQEKLVEPQSRPFKTPAEKKEMPPPPPPASKPPSAFLEHPKIVTEQYNNHTYNNPTINYHMNNVPYQFFPCGSLSYFPPILLPLNSTATFDMNLVQPQQQQPQPQAKMPETISRPRREKKSKRKKRD